MIAVRLNSTDIINIAACMCMCAKEEDARDRPPTEFGMSPPAAVPATTTAEEG